MTDISGPDAIRTRPTIWRAAILAHRDAYAALKAMPVMAVALILASLGQSLGDLYFRDELPYENYPASIALTIAWTLLSTPILIAIHRFIILGETTTSYRITWTRRYTAFFQWSFAINGGLLLLSAMTTLFQRISLGLGWFWIFVGLIVFYVLLRISILFPAIAVDAPSASYRNAYRDTKGHGFTILMIFIASSLPMLIFVLALTAIFGLPEKAGLLTVAKLFETLLIGLVGAFYYAVFVAAVSRLFEWMGNRLKQMAGT